MEYFSVCMERYRLNSSYIIAHFPNCMVIYYIVIQFVLKLGLSTDDLKLLTAVVVTLFLAIPYWKARYNQTHVKGGK